MARPFCGSPPPRGRGSKRRHSRLGRSARGCRPLHGGADRNLAGRCSHRPPGQSPPPRGRGSKLADAEHHETVTGGRPLHGGADRNLSLPTISGTGEVVAPSTGARIETTSTRARAAAGLSPPPRGRGSKRRDQSDRSRWSRRRPLHGGADRNHVRDHLKSIIRSPPPRGRGSKPAVPAGRPPAAGSPPPRGRGSKQRRAAAVAAVLVSPPPRGRGSKLRAERVRQDQGRVAPSTGARIEVSGGSSALWMLTSAADSYAVRVPFMASGAPRGLDPA